MPEAFSTPNLVALPITSQELDRGVFLPPPPTKIVLSNSPTTIGLAAEERSKEIIYQDLFQVHSYIHWSSTEMDLPYI